MRTYIISVLAFSLVSPGVARAYDLKDVAKREEKVIREARERDDRIHEGASYAFVGMSAGTALGVVGAASLLGEKDARREAIDLKKQAADQKIRNQLNRSLLNGSLSDSAKGLVARDLVEGEKKVKILTEIRKEKLIKARPKGSVGFIKLSAGATAVSTAIFAGYIVADVINHQNAAEDLATLRSHRSILTELDAKRKVASQPQGQEVSGAEASLAE